MTVHGSQLRVDTLAYLRASLCGRVQYGVGVFSLPSSENQHTSSRDQAVLSLSLPFAAKPRHSAEAATMKVTLFSSALIFQGNYQVLKGQLYACPQMIQTFEWSFAVGVSIRICKCFQLRVLRASTFLQTAILISSLLSKMFAYLLTSSKVPFYRHHWHLKCHRLRIVFRSISPPLSAFQVQL